MDVSNKTTMRSVLLIALVVFVFEANATKNAKSSSSLISTSGIDCSSTNHNYSSKCCSFDELNKRIDYCLKNYDNRPTVLSWASKLSKKTICYNNYVCNPRYMSEKDNPYKFYMYKISFCYMANSLMPELFDHWKAKI